MTQTLEQPDPREAPAVTTATNAPEIKDFAPPAPAAAEPGSEIVYRIPFHQIRPSATNPRKTTDPKADAELTASIKQHDIQAPVILRTETQGNTKYELVIGSRRFRCAKKAGRDDVPAIIREMTDEEARELQLVENAQRLDVSPLEEARGLKALINLPNPPEEMQKKKPRSRAEVVAQRIGKSASYIYARLKLCELIPAAQKAMDAGKLPAAHALLIARLPASAQKDRLADCFPKWDIDLEAPAIGVRELAQRIAQTGFKDLTQAKFDILDPNLLPKAGSCLTCPKLAKNDPAQADLAEKTCTDRACHDVKLRASIQKRIDDSRAAGKPLLQLIDAGYTNKPPEPGADEIRWGQYESAGGKDKQCKSQAAAIRIDGYQAGDLLTVCIDRKCPVHWPAQTKPKGKPQKKNLPALEACFHRLLINDALSKQKNLSHRGLLEWLFEMAADRAEWQLNSLDKTELTRGILTGPLPKLLSGRAFTRKAREQDLIDCIILLAVTDQPAIFKAKLPCLRKQAALEIKGRAKTTKAAAGTIHKNPPAGKTQTRGRQTPTDQKEGSQTQESAVTRGPFQSQDPKDHD